MGAPGRPGRGRKRRRGGSQPPGTPRTAVGVPARGKTPCMEFIPPVCDGRTQGSGGRHSQSPPGDRRLGALQCSESCHLGAREKNSSTAVSHHPVPARRQDRGGGHHAHGGLPDHSITCGPTTPCLGGSRGRTALDVVGSVCDRSSECQVAATEALFSSEEVQGSSSDGPCITPGVARSLSHRSMIGSLTHVQIHGW